MVCGVRSGADAAVPVVRRLQADLPDADIRLVIDDRLHGANNKVSNLINMMKACDHDTLVIADSDMRVGPDYLAAVVGALQRPGVGLATCLYTGRGEPGPWSAIGAAGINFWFLPSAAVSKQLGGKIGCYGATIALQRATLDAVGGFAAVRNQLADDYALGALVRDSGKAVVVVPYFPVTIVNEPTASALYRHEMRWARTIRNTAPLGYAGSAVTHPVPTAMLGLMLGSVAGLPWQMLITAMTLALASRLLLVARLTATFGVSRPAWWLLLLRDVLSLVILVVAFCGRSVSWRDSAFRVDRVGALSPESDGI
jgi:ceramide glucosyltransferase